MCRNADAISVARLRAAGAVVVGKLATHEFAFGGPVLRPALAAGAQPVEHEPLHRRLVAAAPARRSRPGWCSAAPAAIPAARSAAPAAYVRPRRPEADLWAGQPDGHPAARLLARPCRPDGVDRRGLRDHAAGDGRARPGRPGQRQSADPGLPGGACRAGSRGCGSASSVISTSATTRPTPRRGRRSTRRRRNTPRSRLHRSATSRCRRSTTGRPAASRSCWRKAYAIHEDNLQAALHRLRRDFPRPHGAGRADHRRPITSGIAPPPRAGGRARPAMADLDLVMTAAAPSEAPPIDAVGKFATLERPSLTMPFNVTGSPAMSVCCGYTERGCRCRSRSSANPSTKQRFSSWHTPTKMQRHGGRHGRSCPNPPPDGSFYC